MRPKLSNLHIKKNLKSLTFGLAFNERTLDSTEVSMKDTNVLRVVRKIFIGGDEVPVRALKTQIFCELYEKYLLGG